MCYCVSLIKSVQKLALLNYSKGSTRILFLFDLVNEKLLD